MAKLMLSKIAKKRKKITASKSSTSCKSKDSPALVTPLTVATIIAQRFDENYALLVFSFFLILLLTYLLVFIHKRATLDDILMYIVLNPCSIALEAKEHDMSSKKHAHEKVTIADDFFNIISKVDSLKVLVNFVPVDPSIPSIQTWTFYLQLRGNRDEKKFAVLNLSLLHFA